MNHVVSVPIDEKVAELLGKKGSVNGLTFFNRKSGDDVIVTLYPTNAEEKPYGLAESMLVSEQIVISTADVGKAMGEALVAASLLDKRVLITDDNDIGKFLANGLLKKYEIVGREKLLEKVLEYRDEAKAGITRIDIDKAFPVNGIGTVLLGVVMSGTLKVHDNLYHSSGKQVLIRSIQSQDVDVKEAEPGTRAGLAIKGMEHTEIEKGDVIASKAIPKVKRIKGRITLSKIANERISETAAYLVVSNFSHSPAKIRVNGDEVEMSLEKPLSVLPGDRYLLLRSASPRVFASGEFTSVEA